jgi:lipoprotein-releasing system ATP-binding protein
MIKVSNLNKSFGNLNVLKDINLSVEKGEIVAITGASGAGKTTLLQIMGTLDSADSGSVFYNDIDILSLTKKDLSNFRNTKIGFVFQFHHLLPEFTAIENVCIPAYINKVSKKQAYDKAKELLEFLSIADRMDHKPSELSGGEQQRVAIARALINSPEVVLADEPSGNLDAKKSEELHELFFKLRDQFSQTFIIVTHDSILADKSDRKLNIKDGIIQI